jgi:hypothetical protein
MGEVDFNLRDSQTFSSTIRSSVKCCHDFAGSQFVVVGVDIGGHSQETVFRYVAASAKSA